MVSARYFAWRFDMHMKFCLAKTKVHWVALKLTRSIWSTQNIQSSYELRMRHSLIFDATLWTERKLLRLPCVSRINVYVRQELFRRMQIILLDNWRMKCFLEGWSLNNYCAANSSKSISILHSLSYYITGETCGQMWVSESTIFYSICI